MAANNLPIYTKKPDLSTDNGTTMSQGITAAAADYTGASANYVLVHTAGTDGSYVKSLILKSKGTNVAAVMRIFINNGGANTSATNNALLAEITLPATTASTTAALPEIEFPLEIGLNPGFRIFAGLGAGVAAGWVVTAVAGQY